MLVPLFPFRPAGVKYVLRYMPPSLQGRGSIRQLRQVGIPNTESGGATTKDGSRLLFVMALHSSCGSNPTSRDRPHQACGKLTMYSIYLSVLFGD